MSLRDHSLRTIYHLAHVDDEAKGEDDVEDALQPLGKAVNQTGGTRLLFGVHVIDRNVVIRRLVVSSEGKMISSIFFGERAGRDLRRRISK